MNLYHYYNKGNVPFLTLSDLTEEDAKKIQDSLKEKDNNYDRRDYDGRYLEFRRKVEENVRKAFIEKGGKPIRKNPIYFILSESHEINDKGYQEWFPNPVYKEVNIDNIDENCVSFTYGDSFVANHPEHQDQTKYLERVFTYDEIIRVIAERGWPHDLLTPDSPFWLPRYIEAQVWCDVEGLYE